MSFRCVIRFRCQNNRERLTIHHIFFLRFTFAFVFTVVSWYYKLFKMLLDHKLSDLIDSFMTCYFFTVVSCYHELFTKLLVMRIFVRDWQFNQTVLTL